VRCFHSGGTYGVISIVTLLIALLVPAVKRACGLAWMTRCAVNLQEMVLANVFYGQDYKDFFDPVRHTRSDWNFPRRSNWSPYFTAPVRCVFTYPGDTTRPTANGVSYVINQKTFQGNWDPRRILSYGTNFRMRLEDIISSDRTVYVRDWWTANDEGFRTSVVWHGRRIDGPVTKAFMPVSWMSTSEDLT
jgi:hypothetical protein